MSIKFVYFLKEHGFNLILVLQEFHNKMEWQKEEIELY